VLTNSFARRAASVVASVFWFLLGLAFILALLGAYTFGKAVTE
jgi:hypothetical protein